MSVVGDGSRIPRPGLESVSPTASGWRGYLAAYHDARPGVTERLLGLAGWSPYEWLVEPLRAEGGPILDLACGSAPTRPLLAEARWIGLDSSVGELRQAAAAGRTPLVRANADALPIASGAISAVCAAMCLQVLTPLDAVLQEVRRVLAPSGTLVALVPARASLRSMPGWSRVLRALGVRRLDWPNPQVVDDVERTLGSHGFTVRSAETRDVVLDVGGADVDLLVDGLYLPDLPEVTVRSAKAELREWVHAGRRLRLSLRLVVADRDDG